MELKQVQAIEGANVFSYRPIIRAVIDLGEWNEITSNTLEDFNLRLLKCLPTLGEHHCSRGKMGGFLERLAEGTLLGHVLEHVVIELLTLAGQSIPYGKTMMLPDCQRQYEIIYNYESQAGALEALQQGMDLLQDLLKGVDVDVASRVEHIKRVISQDEWGPTTRAILEACQERGIPYQRLSDGSLLQLGYGCNQRRIQAAMTDRTSCIAVDIASDKELTKRLLREAGIRVPQGGVARSEDEAVALFKQLGQPVVIKPYNGNQGKGVLMSLRTVPEVRQAFRIAQAYSERVVVEEFIPGNHYRLLVVGGTVIAAAERIPAHVVGDGCSTIWELVAMVNRDPNRGEDHEKNLTKIKVDSVVIMTLAQKGLNLEYVPAEREIVYLRHSANLSTGGIAVDVTDQVHPDNVRLACYAAQVVGLDIAGVDLVVADIEASPKESAAKIIEVNAAPGIRMHTHPSSGQRRDVGRIIARHVLPKGSGRVPIVAVTGTNGKTTTTRLISHMLRDQGLVVGMTSTDGVYVGGVSLCSGDMTGPESAHMVLRHPEVQVAVLETARGGILRAGLGYDYADVAVVTNVTADHLGQYGIETVEDMAHVKSLVAEVVQSHSYVVLNADDPHVLPMARRTKGKVILFSLDKDNIHVRKHLGLGGTAVFLRRGIILLCQGDQSYRVGNVKNLPVTWEGKAKHNVQNVLAAVAAGWALGLKLEVLTKSLGRFNSDAQYNRGRLNLYQIDGVEVVVDYGHNAAGIREIIETLKAGHRRPLVGCLTVPGDRSDESIKEVARLAAKEFSRLIIHEDEDLRGRERGQVAGIMYREAMAAGMKPSQMAVVLPEREAFNYGLDSCQPGDVFVMFYEKLKPIEEEIKYRLNRSSRFDSVETKSEAVAGGNI